MFNVQSIMQRTLIISRNQTLKPWHTICYAKNTNYLKKSNIKTGYYKLRTYLWIITNFKIQILFIDPSLYIDLIISSKSSMSNKNQHCRISLEIKTSWTFWLLCYFVTIDGRLTQTLLFFGVQFGFWAIWFWFLTTWKCRMP